MSWEASGMCCFVARGRRTRYIIYPLRDGGFELFSSKPPRTYTTMAGAMKAAQQQEGEGE